MSISVIRGAVSATGQRRALVLSVYRRPDVMGEFANARLTQVAALVATVLVLLLNIVLLLQTADGGLNVASE